MLKAPPILPKRTPCGEVIEVDENLAGAVSHRMIFTETSQHKDNKVHVHAMKCIMHGLPLYYLYKASLYSGERN